MICVENSLVINALNRHFITFHRLFIALLFLSSHNESRTCNRRRNPYATFVFLYIVYLAHVISAKKILRLSSFSLFLYPLIDKTDRNFQSVYMSFQESETEERTSLLSEVSSLDDDFFMIDLESGNSDKDITDNEVDSQVWSERQAVSNAEIKEDYGLIREGTSVPGDNTLSPIDWYHHFITEGIMELLVREGNRYAEQDLQTYNTGKRSKRRQ